MDWSLSVEQHADATVLHLRGELDMASAPALREACIEVLANNPSTHLIIDLSDVGFIDGTGAGVIAGACTRSKAKGGRLTAVVKSAQVRDVLRLIGLDREWRITTSLDEALGT